MPEMHPVPDWRAHWGTALVPVPEKASLDTTVCLSTNGVRKQREGGRVPVVARQILPTHHSAKATGRCVKDSPAGEPHSTAGKQLFLSSLLGRQQGPQEP